MKRRKFIQNAVLAGAATSIGQSAFSNENSYYVSNSKRFNLKYAPGLGSFPNMAGKDPIDVIKFCRDQGFRAVFDNGLMKRKSSLQEKIGTTLTLRNMDIGPYVLYADFSAKSMVLGTKQSREMLKSKLKKGIETSKRTGAMQALVVPGRYDERLEWGYQTANVVDCLREMSDIAEKAGITIVLEPLNRWDHPGLFLTGIPQAYAICRAVNSPSCKIVNDIYHQQITEGNIIPNIDKAWDEIGAFHLGDSPGRKEPGTGEINYLNIFKHLKRKGYEGILCMEHGKSIEGRKGEMALIAAYRRVDDIDATGGSNTSKFPAQL